MTRLVAAAALALIFCAPLLAQTDTTALSKEVSPADPDISYIGRFDRTDPAGPRCAWSASTIRLKFSGTALNIRMSGRKGEKGWYDLWDVFVDGKRSPVIEITEGQTLYPVARGLPDGEHAVELVKRTEFNVGSTQILGFELDPGARLLSPPPAASRRIEVIGDSISCGYGIEAPTKEEKFTPQRENADSAWWALAARQLDADAICIAWSGKKLWPNNSILDFYDRILPDNKDALWDFKSWIPSAVIINLGTNDFGLQNPDGAGWVAAYRALIQRLRTQYPDAWIYPTLGTMLGDWPAARKPASTIRGYLTGLVADFNRSGDERVQFIDFGTRRAEDGFGGGWHPSPKSHQRMAVQLVTVLTKDLGW